MVRWASIVLASPLLLLVALAAEEKPLPHLVGRDAALVPFVTGLKNPESVCIGADGRTYVTCIGEFDKDGDGSVVVIEDGKAVPFATGLDDPKGIVAAGPFLFVADKTRVWRIDPKGKATVYVEAKAFPAKPIFLNDIESDGKGTLYVSDSGDTKGKLGAIYKISPFRKVTTLVAETTTPEVGSVNGLKLISEYHILAFNLSAGHLLRVRLHDGKVEKLAEGMVNGDGITFDSFGRVYCTSWAQGKVWGIPRAGDKPVLIASGFKTAADLCVSKDGKHLLVPDMLGGALYRIPASIPGHEVDTKPLAVKLEPAFADIEWAGWQGENSKGKITSQRPIMLTHAGDGSGRVFVGEQRGTLHAFKEGDKKTKVFLDITSKVHYLDNENEEGFLGVTFHPKFKANGEFFVFYTPKGQPKSQLMSKTLPKEYDRTNVLSRFRVKKDNPDEADPASEEILMTIKRPFWNHDGGTLVFGPDGFLYVALGDGGKADDPFDNGQNMNSILGKVLRIDVDKKSKGLPYGIPADNPFVGKEGARGEIWAYGFRNIWRMSFDTKTGKLWAADVGQNLWEEIDIVEKGANYGWNRREGQHPFGDKGVGPNPGMVEPIWEYYHDVGKSITGGHVYRGKKVAALEGMYLYADYVSGNIWALRYDEKAKRVTANHPLRKGGFPIYSLGEDENGEVYVLTSTQDAKGIFRFAAK
jgi:glucose/arabinose dehydrogenase